MTTKVKKQLTRRITVTELKNAYKKTHMQPERRSFFILQQYACSACAVSALYACENGLDWANSDDRRKLTENKAYNYAVKNFGEEYTDAFIQGFDSGYYTETFKEYDDRMQETFYDAKEYDEKRYDLGMIDGIKCHNSICFD